MNTRTLLKPITNTSFPFFDDIGRNLFLRDNIFDGWENFFEDVKFPKYNVKSISEGKLEIEIALAGYRKENLSVELSPENILTVATLSVDAESDSDSDTELKSEFIDNDVNYIHHGIAARNFKISWKIGPNRKVGTITFEDGMLRIPLTAKTPPKTDTKRLTIK
jgi:molecular chaperone IbpA